MPLSLLPLFIYIPLAGFLVSLLLPRKKETAISWLAIGTIGLHILGVMGLVIYWLVLGQPTWDLKHLVLFTTPGFQIFLDLYFDKITAVFAFTGSVLCLLVTVFSRYYLHREEGFKRFFSSLLLFFTGYNFIIFSGNFETLFIGWEFLGISSFLLIAFYRDRYLPVKNGLKVISIYRLSDICLMLAMWMSHHLWHENITFFKFNIPGVVAAQLQTHQAAGIFIAVMILIAAAVKSAQFPFSSWLPRAMEGPTTSSAIFYGSLSVHIGVFLLLRTYPFWESIAGIKTAIIAVGLVTSCIAAGIARVQSTVKTQIAYASIVQIGLIFVEIALGWHVVALVHFMGNAFLRTYQLLVSPSVLSYLTHHQFYHFDPKQKKNTLPGKWSATFYVLSIKEWNLDRLLTTLLWRPFKWIGATLKFLTHGVSVAVLVAVAGAALYFFAAGSFISAAIPLILAGLGLLLILRSFAERSDARKPWLLAFAAQFFIVLAVMLNGDFAASEVILYLSGTIVSGIAGYFCLARMKAIDNDISLDHFHGYTYEKPWPAFIFLLCCLGLLGFPITPTFIGVDILFSHVGEHQWVLISFISLAFVFIELALLRIYARIFMGQHKKADHAIAFKSS